MCWWWRKVRKADIPKADRDTFERFGETVIASIIAGGCSPPSELADIYTNETKHEYARAWLTERGDSHERREQRSETVNVILEIAIVALIGWEIRQGYQQANILDKLNASAIATANTLQALQKAQEDSLGTLKDTLQTIQRTNDSIRQQTGLLSHSQESLRAQLNLAKRQYEEQNRRPAVKVWALIYTPGPPGKGGPWSTQLLDPARRGWMAEMNMIVQSDTRYRAAHFVLRNVGTADAVNVAVRPQPSAGVGVICVDYPALSLYTQGKPESSQPCAIPFGKLPPIPAQSKERPGPKGFPKLQSLTLISTCL